jgi:hypothetical protein
MKNINNNLVIFGSNKAAGGMELVNGSNNLRSCMGLVNGSNNLRCGCNKYNNHYINSTSGVIFASKAVYKFYLNHNFKNQKIQKRINFIKELRLGILNKINLKIINNKNLINIKGLFGGSQNQSKIVTRFCNKLIATANSYRFYSSSSSCHSNQKLYYENTNIRKGAIGYTSVFKLGH